jgi:hypothetical protein
MHALVDLLARTKELVIDNAPNEHHLAYILRYPEALQSILVVQILIPS